MSNVVMEIDLSMDKFYASGTEIIISLFYN